MERCYLPRSGNPRIDLGLLVVQTYFRGSHVHLKYALRKDMARSQRVDSVQRAACIEGKAAVGTTETRRTGKRSHVAVDRNH